MNIYFKLVIVTTYKTHKYGICKVHIIDKNCNKMESGCLEPLLTMPRTFFQAGKLWKGTSGYILCFWEGLNEPCFSTKWPIEWCIHNFVILFIFIIFWQFHVCFNHSHPTLPTLPRSTRYPYQPTVSFFPHRSQFVLLKHCGVCPSVIVCWLTKSCTLKENQPLAFQQQRSANSSPAGDECI